jgi:AP2 domain.
MKKKDLLGQRFGRLTVIDCAPSVKTSGGNSRTMWLCRCDCGNEKVVATGDLLSGDTTSCGCYNLEKAHYSKHRITCQYDLSGEYGIGYTSSGDEFWFDKEDYDLIKGYSWFKHHKYFVAKVPMGENKTIYLHRLVMGLGFEEYDYHTEIDHIITENKFDNRKSNLRIVNKSQNNTNKIVQKNNKSGYPGIVWNSRDEVWEVYINIECKKTYLGRFKNKDDAIAKRKWAENKYYGEYSYNNSQKMKEEIK